MNRTIFEPEHEMFRESFRRFLAREVIPHHETWEHDGIVPRALWIKAGEQGYLGMDVPERYGGGAAILPNGRGDFRYNLIMAEEMAHANTTGPGFSLHNDVAIPYILAYGTDDQKARWLPGCVRGETILAIAMTEPGGGSDLASIQTRAIRDGDHYVMNGAKTFITNGIHSDMVIVACKTDLGKKHDGLSLIVVERGMEGYQRGRNLEKVGWHAQDTAELFFQDVRVPVENRLGDEGAGFYYLVQNLPQERLIIAAGALAAAEAALGWTIDYCQQRTAFGQAIGTFQNSRFTLAEMKTEITIGRVFIDRCVEQHLAGDLSADQAAMAKWWATDLQCRVIDQCVQLHGGYGYMREYAIARAYCDMRWGPIGGGTNEIMKDLIGRSMGF